MPTELESQRNLTSAFIARNPTTITLTPYLREANGSGGWRKVAQAPRAPITVTLIPQIQWKGTSEPVRTAEGEVDRFDYVLVAEWNAVVAEDDTFKIGTTDYRVAHLVPSNDYEVKAGVIRYGA